MYKIYPGITNRRYLFQINLSIGKDAPHVASTAEISLFSLLTSSKNFSAPPLAATGPTAFWLPTLDPSSDSLAITCQLRQQRRDQGCLNRVVKKRQTRQRAHIQESIHT